MSVFRFPNVAQELICHGSMMAQSLVEGGWHAEEPEEEEADEADGEEDEEDTLEGETEVLDEDKDKSSDSKEDQRDKKIFTNVSLKLGAGKKKDKPAPPKKGGLTI